MTPPLEIGSVIGQATAGAALMSDDHKENTSFIRPSRAANIVLIPNVSLSFGIMAIFLMLSMLGYGRDTGRDIRRYAREPFRDRQWPETGQTIRNAPRYLLMSGRTDNRSAMRGRFISMLLMFAILFGSLVAPETAHAEALLAGHGTEVLNFEDHAAASSPSHETQKSGTPCHAVVHHHCTIAISPDAGVGSLPVWNAKTAVMPLNVRAMGSLAMAPPTEPPAA